MTAIADGVLRLWFTPAFRSPDNPDFPGYHAMLTRTSVAGYVGTCAALRDVDLTESTRALRLPVLCLVGDQDGSTLPALVRSMADLIVGAQFRVVANTAHLPNV
jgi:3-oxoadipate enol-lactonase